MAALDAHFSETVLPIAGIQTQIRRGGSGAPLLVIHGEHGVPGWLESYRLLAEHYDVIVPSLPGYGGSQRPDWIMGARDVAAWVTWFARESGLSAPLNVIGCSMGGWIAAEIATIAPQFFNKMLLTGAMGVKPRDGEIFDYFLESGQVGISRSFHAAGECADYAKFYGGERSPDELDLIEQHREMTCRIAWKPYMHSLTLPALLPSITTPSLLVWGEQDAIVPVECGRMYEAAIPGVRLETIANCGHMVEMEAPETFAALAREFFGG